MYSSNKIRKTQNEHLNIVYQNLNSAVNNCEFDANFLTFLGLYHLHFALESFYEGVHTNRNKNDPATDQI